ncbi:MAG: hypothetical protein E7554_05235 [Ruminococcaceae bacterium]|nr:hypothetical protein [Oscillospiraceae bacterium]
MHRRIIRIISVTLTALFLISSFAMPAAALKYDSQVIRLGGSTRIGTAALIADSGWDKCENALLANAYSFPDALAGVPLAGALDAPILLTGSGTSLESDVSEQLGSLGVRNVYILGGKAAVSDDIANELTAQGISVTRLAGSDRFGTAVAIAEMLISLKGTPDTVFFSSSANYPDALAGGPAAASINSPIVYIRPDGLLDESTADFAASLTSTGDMEAVILGGNAAVGQSAEGSLTDAGFGSVSRLYGSSRYATCLAINNAYPQAKGARGSLVAATGASFPDALAGGALAAHLGAPIVLVPNKADSEVMEFINELLPSTVYILGGEGALSQTVADIYFSIKPLVSTDEEMRAVWIPYLCQKNIDRAAIDRMVDDCLKLGANTIIFHVRPFGDAMYDSDYFPWSHVISGTQGVAPADGFDPLEYAVQQAHAKGVELHAWINPLRIQLANGSLPTSLSEDNPYSVWRSDADPTNDDWAVDYQKGKFYNPAYPEVRQLIIDGMVEIVENYDVDGIHWDDYFYPAADASFDDSLQYTAYTEAGGTMTLPEWRTENVNTLIRDSYAAVKKAAPDSRFGISPQGNIGNCLRIGADVYEWCANSGYIDYICPQVYWTFDNTIAPFATRCAEWRSMVKRDDIDLYIGLALYKAAGTADGGKWQKSERDIAEQIECLRGGDIHSEGFMIYSYQYLDMPGWENEVEAVRELLDCQCSNSASH